MACIPRLARLRHRREPPQRGAALRGRPELRWFWSITIYVDPKLGITTSGRAATIECAKEQFRQSWERVHAKQA
jgi:hypothetical protein